MKLRRIGGDEFDRVVENTNLQGKARGMARAVLVDGRLQADVASEYGVTRQRVNLAIGVFERAYLKEPAGSNIVQVTLELPENIALSLYTFTETLVKTTDQHIRDQAIQRIENAINCTQKDLQRALK